METRTQIIYITPTPFTPQKKFINCKKNNTMAIPIKKKKQNRTVKSKKLPAYNPYEELSMPSDQISNKPIEAPYDFHANAPKGTIYNMVTGNYDHDWLTKGPQSGEITPDNDPALFAMPTGMGLKMLNTYRKSLSKPAFDLIKKKIIDKTPYGVIANLIEGAIAAFPSSEDKEQTPPKLYRGGSVKTIKRKK